MADIYSDFAEFYDLHVGGWLGDLPFYREHARQVSGAILEIGAGSGRLTIPLAQEGFSLVAVDVSPAMLRLLAAGLEKEPPPVRARIRTVEANVCNLHLGTRHDLVMVPFFTFNYLLTDPAQQVALDRMKDHLSDQGQILIDVLTFHRVEHCPEEPVLRVDTTDRRTGCKVRGWVGYRIDTTNQTELRRHTFEVVQPDGGTIRREFATLRRYLFKEQIERLFAENGLAVQEAYGGFDGQLATDASPRLIYVLNRR